ncbi:MAG: retroviral-like aspartic protease family protein, partial [Elusimicrobiota bacterium]|nr:retroviral-like aspartic protease family protein [Elusimicrobiota bacterium]
MGETFADVKLIANNKQIKKRLLVDTGATYSWIKEKALKELGVRPVRKEKFETIKGKLIPKKVGFVEVECMGERAPTVVVFATRKDSEVLGLHALEG